MSKSRGSEAVEKITNKYGADLLRLWTASIDFTEDVRLSDTILERLIEAYRKLRNTLRYALGKPVRFRSRARRRAGGADARHRPLDSFAYGNADPALPGFLQRPRIS